MIRRRAAGGDADRVGRAVEQLALHPGAAGGVRAARAAAARAARQLIAPAPAPRARASPATRATRAPHGQLSAIFDESEVRSKLK